MSAHSDEFDITSQTTRPAIEATLSYEDATGSAFPVPIYLMPANTTADQSKKRYLKHLDHRPVLSRPGLE